MTELLDRKTPITVQDGVEILRDQGGLHDENVGMANTVAMNQLIAHHGILFEPVERKMWVSTGPYQLGSFVCYNLDSVFAKAKNVVKTQAVMYDSAYTIAADPFLQSKAYQDYLYFREIKQAISDYTFIGISLELSTEQIEGFIKSNSESYLTYHLLGNYFHEKANKEQACKYYHLALSKKVASLKEEREIEERLKECQ
jgi:hypothetical protein